MQIPVEVPRAKLTAGGEARLGGRRRRGDAVEAEALLNHRAAAPSAVPLVRGFLEGIPRLCLLAVFQDGLGPGDGVVALLKRCAHSVL